MAIHANYERYTAAGCAQVSQGCGGSCTHRDRAVWCGVVLAYRFSRPQDLRDTLTLQAGRHPGSHLAAQVRAFLRPKCLAVLLDSSMHGLDVVAFNLHQLSLLGAAKFHATAKALPLGVAHNPAVLVEAVVGAVEYLAVLVRQRTGGSLSPPVGSGGAGSGAAATRNHLVRMGTYCALSRRQVSGCHWLFSLSHSLMRGWWAHVSCCGVVVQIMWLGLHAFATVFARHPDM